MKRVTIGQIGSADDETLAYAARNGDHLAFGEIYRRYEPIFAGYIRTRITDDRVDDVIQNAFLAIHKGLRNYRGPRFFSWAYRVCVNTATDELRKRRRAQNFESKIGAEKQNPVDVDTPEQVFIAKRLECHFQGELRKLPEGQRTVFVLARIEGLEYREIAQLLDIPIGTVKSRMWKAINFLFPEKEGER